MALTSGAIELARDTGKLDLLFLGNATSCEGRAHSSFFVNGQYLFDAGPTALRRDDSSTAAGLRRFRF